MEPEIDPAEFDLEDLRAQQDRLRRKGRLHNAHWIILGASFAITLTAWHLSDSLLQQRANEQFERYAAGVVDMLTGRLVHYEDALLAGVAATLTHADGMDREQWRNYANTLGLDRRYPGVNGIGVIREVAPSDLATFETDQRTTWPDFHVFPEHDFPIRLPIVHIEPVNDNEAAIGLDVAFEENRRTAALLARDLGTVQISGPITLVQDANKTPGFLFYAPFYRDDTGFAGLVYAPLVVDRLVQGVLGELDRQMLLSIHDDDTALFDEFTTDAGRDDQGAYTYETTEDLYGRTWRFTLTSTAAFLGTTGSLQPTVVLLSGMTIHALLLVLFLVLVQTNRRVLDLAESMTNRLAGQATTLATKNGELERFAYVASHDLKTPLRAIDNLTSFMKEDIDESLTDDATRSMMLNHTQRIDEQLERSFALIQSVLDYSVIGHGAFTPQRVDPGTLIAEIGRDLGIQPDQLVIDDTLPHLHTCPVRLTQVFENLVGNAYKYHPTPETASIAVSAVASDSHFRFFVSDDGSGIDEQYHERVFRPFTTLQQKPAPGSSGIGLSIVKKSVEFFGGSTGILTSSGQGTTFYFDWPTHHADDTESEAHAA